MDQEFYQRDINRFNEEISDLTDIIEDRKLMFEDAAGKARGQRLQEKLATFTDRILGEVEALRDAVGHLQEHPGSRRVTVYVFTTAQVLQDEVDSTVAAIEEEEDDEDGDGDRLAQTAKNWINNTLKPKIKQVLNKLWKVLTNLLHPQEWKVRGQIGSSFLGLGSAEIEITFGP